MTLFAAYIREREAHVLSDTASYDASGALRYMAPKAFPLPHVQAVVSGRGADDVIQRWTFQLLRSPLPHGLDTIIDVSPAMLRNIYADYVNELRPYYHALGRRMDLSENVAENDLALMSEAFAVGWSPCREKMIAVCFSNLLGQTFEANLFLPPNLMAAPTPSRQIVPQGKKPRVPADMERLGRAMYDKLDDECRQRGQGGALCGGELHLTTINRRGLEITTIAKLPGYDQQVAALEAAA